MTEALNSFPLGKLCKEVYRYPSYYGIDYVDEGIPEIRGELILGNGLLETAPDQLRYIASETAEKFPRTCLEPGDLVMSVRGTIGKIGLVPESLKGANMTANLIRIAPDRDLVEPKYLWHFMRTDRFIKTLDHISPSTTIKTIRSPDLQAIPVPLPPIEEQRRIAAILDKADGVRRKRKEAIALTEDLLRAAFLDMFGDPVTNPKGWEILPMKQIVVETQYGTAEKSNESMNGLPVLRMNNITYSGEFDLNSLKWCQISPKDEEKFTVRRGDLLFNRTNSPELVGKTAVWRSDKKFVFAGYLIRVRFDGSRAYSEYVSAFLNSNYGKKYLLEKAKPSINMSNFSASEFLKIPIPLPDIKDQQRFREFVNSTRRMSKKLSNRLGDYNNLFNSLLQRAFRGEL